ncbi:MAG: hypothetical protein PHN39_01065 [Candidatus Pacebacteria bacterium]|nr:hypothetical protein [Candidatus Paceibacterota bacterium]
MAKQIIGWVLLISGLMLIVWGLVESWQIFKGQKEAPAIFKAIPAGGSSLQLQTNLPGINADQLQKQMQEAVDQQLGKIIPQDTITKIFNLVSWSLFIFILFAAGGKIAIIGVNLLKQNKNNA